MTTQLLVYGFGAEGDFSGQVLGALERLEGGGALRVADALFVLRDAESGELSAVGLGGRRLDAMVGTLVELRHDAGKRRRVTERALGDDAIRELAGALAPGTALVAVLVEHVWADALDEAASRSGGARLIGEVVHASDLGELTARLSAAARGLAPAQG